MKLWNIYTGDCMNTFDEHGDRIWDITFSSSDGMDSFMASGGSDGTLIVWQDATESDRQEALDKIKEETKNEQELQNALKVKIYSII